MGSSRLLAFITVAWVSYAHALDRAGAIEVAKREVRGRCGAAVFCTFDPRLENNKWHVRVEFKPAGAANDKAPSSGGSPAIFVIDQSGRIVGRIEGKSAGR